MVYSTSKGPIQSPFPKGFDHYFATVRIKYGSATPEQIQQETDQMRSLRDSLEVNGKVLPSRAAEYKILGVRIKGMEDALTDRL